MFIELAPLIVPKVKQRLIVAGVLVHQADDVRAAYVRLGMVPAGQKIQGEWIRLDFDAARAANARATPRGPKKKPRSATRERAMAKLRRSKRA